MRLLHTLEWTVEGKEAKKHFDISWLKGGVGWYRGIKQS